MKKKICPTTNGICFEKAYANTDFLQGGGKEICVTKGLVRIKHM